LSKLDTHTIQTSTVAATDELQHHIKGMLTGATGNLHLDHISFQFNVVSSAK